MITAKDERRKDAESGHIFELENNGYIVDMDDNKDFVFISYSSANWRRALYEIVYNTCMKYGLRVYFDTNFDVGSDSWIKQFYDNMRDDHCKAVLCFFSPQYMSSYACLMELMASQTSDVGQKLVLPIVLGSSEVTSTDNTGLGTARFPDNSENGLWDKELSIFNECFIDLVDDPEKKAIKNRKQALALYKRSYEERLEPYKEKLDFERLKYNDAYWEERNITSDEDKKAHWKTLTQGAIEKEGKIYLTKVRNAKLVKMLKSNIEKNDIDGKNKAFEDAIHDKLVDFGLSSVFYPDLIRKTESKSALTVNISNETNQTREAKEEASHANDNFALAANRNQITSTANPVKERNIWIYTAKGAVSYIEWDGESKHCIVKKGSKVAAESNGFANLTSAKSMKTALLEKGVIVADEFVTDYSCDKISTMVNVLTGGSVSLPKAVKDGVMRKSNGAEIDRNTQGNTSGIVEPVALGGIGENGNIKAKKATKLLLGEMVKQGIVSASDEVYVKNHQLETGILTSEGNILYGNQEFSLNQYVMKILGPGNRNAYEYVFHKPTGKLLNELR